MNAMLLPTLILALAALPHAAQAAQAAQAPQGAQGPQARAPRAQRMAQALNLTEVQKTSIRAIREKRRPDLLVRRDSARQAQVALRTALRDANSPETQLRSLHDKASAAQFEMRLARRAVHQEVLTVLTPEQRAKALELQTRRQAMLRERRRHLRQAEGMAS